MNYNPPTSSCQAECFRAEERKWESNHPTIDQREVYMKLLHYEKSFLDSSRVWTQHVIIAKQVLLPSELLHQSYEEF
jgi:hypothetical protein